MPFHLLKAPRFRVPLRQLRVRINANVRVQQEFLLVFAAGSVKFVPRQTNKIATYMETVVLLTNTKKT